ncbi:hypothetical protein [Maribacter sp. IgM3_T14_3]|uniref:hypothetical protein n=1 Tax=Maribacter sp. IgM3_T14_3 TaxID=3415140 RepID=UPI003C6F9325
MDGGYYAIKGFEYQIDKSILEVLSCNDIKQEVYIEQIQDLNTESFVMQIKYKEASKLIPSVIRKPIIQLINEFKNNPTKNYILYCYFSDTNGYTEKVDLVFLDNILGKEKDNFNSTIKNDFLVKFQLCFSENFQNQFQLVLGKILEYDFCVSKDDAIYFYAIIADYLRKKVVDNPSEKIASRKVTKDELLNYLNKGRRITFLPAYREYRGEQEYFKLLKSQFKKPIKNQNTVILFGEIKESNSCKLPSLIYQIIEKHYTKATHDIKPLIFIIPDNKTVEVKTYLIKQNHPFNDGYEMILFSQNHFESYPIINKKTSGGKATSSLSKTSFKARVISNSTLNKIAGLNINVSWIFIDVDKHMLLGDSEYQNINNLNTEQILKLF